MGIDIDEIRFEAMCQSAQAEYKGIRVGRAALSPETLALNGLLDEFAKNTALAGVVKNIRELCVSTGGLIDQHILGDINDIWGDPDMGMGMDMGMDMEQRVDMLTEVTDHYATELQTALTNSTATLETLATILAQSLFNTQSGVKSALVPSKTGNAKPPGRNLKRRFVKHQKPAKTPEPARLAILL